jgi:tRNA uridine 5-carboxymethylaminomethyl modification enzyme
MSYHQLESIFPSDVPLDEEVKEQVEIQLKYEGYITKSLQQVDRLKKMEDKKIPENIDYDAVSGLATEARQKLKIVKPLSIAQASRISGVNPADISILLVYLEQGRIARVSNE